jgi:hypothetical protein
MGTRNKKTDQTGNPEAPNKEKTPEERNEKRVPFTRDLSCALTREEVEERAQEAAALLERRDQKEADLKEQQKRWKNEISQLDVEHRIVSSEVRSKSTVRPVECERVFDYDSGKVREVRLDTLETLHTRNMTDSERQRDLDLGDDFEG